LLFHLTTKTTELLPGEFVLSDWAAARLHVPTAGKRGLYRVHQTLIVKLVGHLGQGDARLLEQSLRQWLGLQ
jgi:mRNA interferase MazF